MGNSSYNHYMPEDAIEMLQADHKKVRDHFRRYEAATDADTKGRIALHAFIELALHAQLEEQVFYPACARATGQNGRIADNHEDHENVRGLIDVLRGIAPAVPIFHALFQKLRDLVESHIAAEETELFPAAAVALADHMDHLTIEMQALKRKLLSV